MAQVPIVVGDVREAVAVAVGAVAEAARAGAALVVFPELHLGGYDLDAIDPGLALGSDDERLTPLLSACRRSRTGAVVSGVLPVGDGELAIGALVIASDGRIVGRYVKHHLWGRERDLFVSVPSGLVWPAARVGVGVGVCNDGAHADHAAAAAKHGAGVYALPSASSAPDANHRRHRGLARQLRLPVLFANYAQEGARSFTGRSAIFDSAGETVASAGAAPEVLVGDVRPRR